MAKKDTTSKGTKTSPSTKEEAQSGGFIKETQEELAKIVWPSRQQLISESVAVILMVILVATVIYLVDNLFTWVSGRVF
ncbi:MAG: preprotein translocase subunit SecE [Microcystaceae cyanobacterium]